MRHCLPMRWLRSARFLVPAILAVTSACTSFTTLHTARPIPEGETQITVAPVVYGSAGLDENSGLGTGEFVLRYGLTDSIDAGLKYVWPFTVAADLNVALIDSDGFVLSLDPTIQPWYLNDNAGNSTMSIDFYLPLLADVITTDSMTFTLTFRPGIHYGAGTTTDRDGIEQTFTGWLFYVGGGASLRIMISDSFGLLPEIGILYEPRYQYALWTTAFGFIFNIL